MTLKVFSAMILVSATALPDRTYLDKWLVCSPWQKACVVLGLGVHQMCPRVTHLP